MPPKFSISFRLLLYQCHLVPEILHWFSIIWNFRFILFTFLFRCLRASPSCGSEILANSTVCWWNMQSIVHLMFLARSESEHYNIKQWISTRKKNKSQEITQIYLWYQNVTKYVHVDKICRVKLKRSNTFSRIKIDF